VLLQINKDRARPSGPNDFEHAGEDVNPTSGRPVLKIAGQAWYLSRPCWTGTS